MPIIIAIFLIYDFYDVVKVVNMMQTLKLVPNSTKNNFEKFEVPSIQIARTPEQKNDSFVSKEENKTENIEKKDKTENKTTDVIKNKGIKEKTTSAFGKVINFFKSVAKTKETAKGTLKGLRNGAIATVGVAFVGKNLQEGEGKILSTITAMGKNIGKVISTTVTKVIPTVFTKSPKEYLSSIRHLPKGFYNYCSSGVEKGAKGSKTVGIVSTLAGIGVLGYNIIKGLAKGNMKKADIDHYTDNGHVPVK